MANRYFDTEITMVVETKLSCSFEVMRQAHYWTHHANYTMIAVPYATERRSTQFRDEVLRHFGIGLMYVDHGMVREIIPPALHRKIFLPIRKHVTEQHKDWCAAGSAEGGYLTPFAVTCKEIQRFVSANPGCLLKDVIEGVETHYRTTSTARSCISRYAQRGIIKGIRLERDGKSLRFFPEVTNG